MLIDGIYVDHFLFPNSPNLGTYYELMRIEECIDC